jgi:LysM repeat protein
MTHNHRSVLALSITVIAAVMLSACTQSLSSAPVETPTLIPTGLFVSPVASVENPMAMIEQFAKQTEAAQTAAAGGAVAGTPGTPIAAVTGTPGTAVAIVTATPTVAVNAATPTNANAAAATPVTAATSAPAATSVPPGVRPPTYVLKQGEFPYCIARRYNVDPDALLQASGLTAAQAENLSAGTTLTIPQSAGPFPGNRALKAHPTTYTVSSGDETVYSIACLFGDVDPNAIVNSNPSITASSKLTVGQVLQIP